MCRCTTPCIGKPASGVFLPLDSNSDGSTTNSSSGSNHGDVSWLARLESSAGQLVAASGFDGEAAYGFGQIEASVVDQGQDQRQGSLKACEAHGGVSEFQVLVVQGVWGVVRCNAVDGFVAERLKQRVAVTLFAKRGATLVLAS